MSAPLRRIGAENDSAEYWSELTEKYIRNLSGRYHAHRLRVIDALIPDDIYNVGRRVLDFGCGNAVHFRKFHNRGVRIEGLDISEAMIAEASENIKIWGMSPDAARTGGVSCMSDMPAYCLDAIVSFNVLAYLTDEEERSFYGEVQRLLKPGGQLIVTHSNSLFDMFSLNDMTSQFFRDNFGVGESETLLRSDSIDVDRPRYNVRENPLTYRYKLARYGLDEQQQEFINYHPQPPALMPVEREYMNTLDVAEDQSWKLMFQCSTYGSRSVRRGPAQ